MVVHQSHFLGTVLEKEHLSLTKSPEAVTGQLPGGCTCHCPVSVPLSPSVVSNSLISQLRTIILMKNTSRKSVQDRFNLMWKRISGAHYVHRKLRSASAFKYPDLKMPQCFEGNKEYFFVFVFLISFRKK